MEKFMAVMIFFNLFLVPMTCIFILKSKKSMKSDVSFWSSYGCYSLLIHLFSECCFRFLFKGITNNMKILCSFKYTLIAFAASLLLGIAINLIPKSFLSKVKE